MRSTRGETSLLLCWRLQRRLTFKQLVRRSFGRNSSFYKRTTELAGRFLTQYNRGRSYALRVVEHNAFTAFLTAAILLNTSTLWGAELVESAVRCCVALWNDACFCCCCCDFGSQRECGVGMAVRCATAPVALMLVHYDMPKSLQSVSDNINLVCTAVFILEAAIKLPALGTPPTQAWPRVTAPTAMCGTLRRKGRCLTACCVGRRWLRVRGVGHRFSRVLWRQHELDGLRDRHSVHDRLVRRK